MKRRWWIVLGSAGLAAIGLLVGLSVFFGDPINQENFEKIQTGMTEADIVRLLGRPPSYEGIFIRVDDITIDQAGAQVVKNRTFRQKAWEGGRTSILLAFTEDGTVERNCSRFVERETVFAGIRRWLQPDPRVPPPPVMMPVMASPYNNPPSN
jgi:hypothetical protein